MIPFCVYPCAEVERLFSDPMPAQLLRRYESVRPDVLHDNTQDIFSPNSRSARHPTDFSLFQQVDPEEAGVVVCLNWLEVAQHCGIPEKIPQIVNAVLDTYPDKVVVFCWNHDIDAADIPALQDLPERALVLNYNTSRPTPNDLLLPFWNVDPNPPRIPKKFFAGFQGTGTIFRHKLREAVKFKKGYYFSTGRIAERDYLELTSSFRFSLCPRGGGLSSYRFFESIHCGSVPVLFADKAALPYPDLDYSEFSIRLTEADALYFETVDGPLRAADCESMTAMLPKVAERFTLLGVQREVHRRLEEMLV